MGHAPQPTARGRTPVVLVLTVPPDEREHEADRIEEMKSLIDTAGREVVATLSQHLHKPHAATYIGSGKVGELAALLREHRAEEAIFDVELTPSQARNVEEEIAKPVLDYNELILEIFARNARTHQSRLAVELAQLEYARSRLKRMWSHLDRQAAGGAAGSGGAIRGPGEKQIEIDKRLVRRRIIDLRDELHQIEGRRERTVAARADAFNVALVGYTNAGKSTLMNALTRAGVLAEDRLFATLDTRTARLHIEGVPNAVLSDTVGFIRNLPPQLIASFHATLAEVREADLLLHVIDASSQAMDTQIDAVTHVLEEIGAGKLPTIMVFNKIDRAFSKTLLHAYRRRYPGAVAVSALNGDGLDDLRVAIRDSHSRRRSRVLVRFPASDGALSAFIRSRVTIAEERYEEEDAVLAFDADERLVDELRTHPNLTFLPVDVPAGSPHA